MTVIAVNLWGRRVGALSDEDGLPAFEYDPEWRASGHSISPIHLPLEAGVFSFPDLRRQEGFEGMPGVFADSLPDRFGNRVIRAYLERKNLSARDISPVQKLLYVGQTGMGALEYEPAENIPYIWRPLGLELSRLVNQARKVVQGDSSANIPDIMAAASSAGGMRAKALVGWNRASQEMVINSPRLPDGFEPWIIKFDGMGEDGESQYWTKLEYAYNQMAIAAGLVIAESALIPDDDLMHFASRRFDRIDGGKVHMHSLCGLQHADFNQPDVWSYEMYFRSCLKLGLGMDELEEAWRRMVFNVMARNQDDHTKNLAFLLPEPGADWKLAPAFDVTYANGAGYTRTHQMSVNGKFKNITGLDLQETAELFGIRRYREIISQVKAAVSEWQRFGSQAGLDETVIKAVAADHELLQQ